MFLSPSVDVSVVPNGVDYNRLFLPQNLIDDPIITHTKFVEACEVAC